jgi:predicted methyltransferase
MAEFFEKLQEKIKLEEGIEGIRDILLVIYRNGTISIKNISRITNIPIPVVSKIVNMLVEKNLLTKNELGVQFWEESMKFIEEHFKFYGFGVKTCPTCKGQPAYTTPRIEILFDILNPIFEERPSVDTTFDQSKNTVETAIHRALYFYNLGAIEGKDVLLIGDDDFTSVALGSLYSIFFPDEPNIIAKSITVIDIDDRILHKIRSIFEKKNLKINCINYNLKDPIPKEYLHKFDTIITDPPYSPNGIKLFMSRAISMIKGEESNEFNKDIFLSFAHRSSQRTLEFQKILLNMNLALMEIIPRFNKYEGSEVLGNQTQMIRLKTTHDTKPLIKESETFNEPMYTGETHPYIRKYKCMDCGAIIEVGTDRQFQTIELLKGNLCPQCHVSKKFELIERNLDLE